MVLWRGLNPKTFAAALNLLVRPRPTVAKPAAPPPQPHKP